MARDAEGAQSRTTVKVHRILLGLASLAVASACAVVALIQSVRSHDVLSTETASWGDAMWSGTRQAAPPPPNPATAVPANLSEYWQDQEPPVAAPESDAPRRLNQLAAGWAQLDSDKRDWVLEPFANLDAVSLSAVLAHLPDEVLASLLRLLFRRSAALDPKAAIALAETFPPGKLRTDVSLEIAFRWAEDDLPGAIVWVAQWPEDAAKPKGVQGLRMQLATANPDDMGDMSELIAAVSAGPMKSELVIGLVSRWAEKDYPAALAWTLALPETTDRERALLELGYRG